MNERTEGCKRNTNKDWINEITIEQNKDTETNEVSCGTWYDIMLYCTEWARNAWHFIFHVERQIKSRMVQSV
jgi:hypothetical protein